MGVHLDLLALLLPLYFAFVTALTEIPEVSNEKVREFLMTHDRSQPPPNGPTKVRIGMYVNELRIYDQESVFEIVMYLRTAWQDDRLKALITDEDKAKGVKRVKFEPSSHKYFWRPDLFFRNHRASDRRASITEEAYMGINVTGHVWQVYSYTTTFHCPGLPRQYYDNMPHVTCPVMIESFANSPATMDLGWMESKVQIDSSIDPMDFKVVEAVTGNCSQEYIGGVATCVKVDFVLDRNPVPDHVGQSLYVSSVLLLIAAWGGFWMDGSLDMTRRLILGLGTTATLLLELAGAATWYEEWDLMGNKTQFWLAFCALLASTTICELIIAHVILPKCLSKVKGTSVGAVQVSCDGEEIAQKEGTIGRVADIIFGIILCPAIFVVFMLVFFIKYGKSF